MTDESLTNWIEQMNQRHGFGAGGSEAGEARSGGTQEIVFGDDEGAVVEVPVHDGDPGVQAEQQIINILQQFIDSVQNFWANYRDGLSNFSEAMQFESDQAAEPQHLKAVFKELAKKAFDDALGEVAKRAGPWGQVIGVVKTGVTAWVAESERAAAAAGQVVVRDYIASIRNGIAGQRDRMIAGIESQRRPLIQEFQSLARGDAGQGQPTPDGRIVGQAATVLNELRTGVTGFRSAIPSASGFQQLFTRNFANTPGWSGPLTQGARLSGTLHFEMQLYVDPTGEPTVWEVKGKDSSWNLVTSSPNPDRVASSLAASLSGKKPWEIDLPKMVKLRVEVEEPMLNSYVEGFIRFTGNPTSFEVRSNFGDRWFSVAWNNRTIRQAALGVTRLIGSAE